MDRVTGTKHMQPLSESYNWEVLKMARDLVINEYTDRRAQLHNEWVSKSRLFNKSGGVLPYPEIPPYPTELEILDRAQSLLNFLNSGHASAADGAKDDPTPPQPDTNAGETQLDHAAVEDSRLVDDSRLQQSDEMLLQLADQPTDQDSVTEAGLSADADKLVPSVIKRLSQIRKSWN